MGRLLLLTLAREDGRLEFIGVMSSLFKVAAIADEQTIVGFV
jgi:hypothetical protein